MNNITIDIAILPPEDIMSLCIDINKKAHLVGNDKGQLNKTDFLPHITLAMGTVKEKDFQKLIQKVELIVSKFSKLNLTLEKFYFITDKTGKRCYGFKITGEKLQQLHETLMDELNHLISNEGKKESTYDQAEIPTFANEYDKYSYKKYFPHITLKCREINEIFEKKSFITSRIAICHLGISSTCRKILFETKLKQN